MSGDQLDLDALEARMAEWQHVLDTGRYDEDLVGELAGYVWPLVAEVRRLRALVDAEPETWPDGNRRVPGESFDDYNARMIDSLNNIPDDQLARHPDGTLDTEPACWCNVPALLQHMRCPRHLGYYP